MAAFIFNVAKPILLDEAFPDGDYVCGLFCNSANFADYAAITHVDAANGYAEQTLSSWDAANLNVSDEGVKQHVVTFAHDGNGNFTSGVNDPADIYGVYISDGTDIQYHVFPNITIGGTVYSPPYNIGPGQLFKNVKITIQMKLT